MSDTQLTFVFWFLAVTFFTEALLGSARGWTDQPTFRGIEGGTLALLFIVRMIRRRRRFREQVGLDEISLR